MQPNTLSLLELNTEIKSVLKDNTAKRYWVIGEISELKTNVSGHCYLELIQKNENTEQIVARSRATIWGQNYRLIKPYFETTTGQPFTEGLGIMVKVSVEFHEVFGLSLNIHDIEPTYTVGEMALQKQKIIERLMEEGVMDMNKDLELPLPCRKIAIISSSTAAGYGDFIDQLLNNPYGYIFYLKLFPAVMQGEDAEQSIINALDKIYSYESFFDAVVIIRGGGSQADLNCFNSYWLSYHIAQYPLPVLSGIGHEQDDTVVDMVAHTRSKTPTAVASFLIDTMAGVEDELNSLAAQIQEEAESFLLSKYSELETLGFKLQLGVKNKVNRVQQRLQFSNNLLISRSKLVLTTLSRKIDHSFYRLSLLTSRMTDDQFRDLKTFSRLLKSTVLHRTKQLQQKHISLEKRLRILDPQQVLERGYSITLKNGSVVKDSNLLAEGDAIETIFNKGRSESIIKKTKK